MTLDFVKEWIRASFTSSWVPKRNVAACYALGDGVRQNGRRARSWYHRAAQAGDSSALYDLGLMLLYGEGGAVNISEGRSLILAAASARDPAAERLVAEFRALGLFGFS